MYYMGPLGNIIIYFYMEWVNMLFVEKIPLVSCCNKGLIVDLLLSHYSNKQYVKGPGSQKNPLRSVNRV